MERYRFYEDAAICFVTFSVVQWLPVFVAKESFEVVTQSLIYCHNNKGLRINAYVLMPTHFHGIVFHESFESHLLVDAINNFRKFTGRQLCELCQRRMPTCFTEVFQSEARDDRRRRFWQPTRHPVMIESESFWRTKFDYLHENPCRKGLVSRAEDWRYSSARFWLGNGNEPADVPMSVIQW